MAIRLPVIARRCDRSFEAMPGNEQTRFCDECGKYVHDLSARTEAEARAFVDAARGQRVCVRYARDARGAVRFRAAVAVAAISMAACGEGGPPRTPAAPPAPVEEIGDRDMGEVIPDEVDRCPDVPDADSTAEDGCPDPEPVTI